MSDATTSGVRLDNLALRERFVTPDSAPVDYVCRRIRIPNDIKLLAAIDELIGVATNPAVWEASSSGLSALEAAALAGEVYLWSACMIGAILAYVGDNPPPGMLTMNGGVHDQADYPQLYAVIPALWQLPDDQFYLPAMDGEMLVGAGAGYAVNATGGAAEHTLTEAEMPSHTHTTQPHEHGYTAPVSTPDALGELPTASVTTRIPATTTASQVLVDSAGDGQPHNNMPPYRAFHWGIVAQ